MPSLHEPLQGVDARATGGDDDVDNNDSVTSPTDLMLNAGVGHGVSIKAVDGSFEFQARARLHLRAQATVDDDADDEEAALRPELFVRRARIVFGGRVLHDLFQWQVQLGLAPNDVEKDLPIIVRDAYVTWNGPLHLGVRVGQMKVPFDRQRLTSSSAQQLTERSRVVNELNLDRDIGAQLIHSHLLGDTVAVQLGVFGGDGRNRPVATPSMLSVARVQLSPLGAFDDLVEGDVARSAEPRLAVAVAAAYNVNTTRSRSTHGDVVDVSAGGGIDYAHATADAVFKWHGVSAMVSGLARVALADGGSDVAVARSAAGGVAQVGVFVVDGLELVGRGSVTVPLDVTTWDGAANEASFAASGEQWEGTVGTNFFFSGHNLKLQLDAGLVGDEVERPDFQARSQLQLFF